MKYWGHVVSLSMAVMLSGCASSYSDSGTFIPSPKDVGNMLFSKKETPQELIAKSQDKELTKTFAEGKFAKVTSINALPYGLLLECKRLYETDSFIYLSQSRQFYRGKSSDFLNDDIAKAYIDTIQKRGNGYSIYNGEGNQALLKAYVGGSLKENTKTEIYMYDSDFAIVEYNKAGEKVSALIRQARIEPSQLGSTMGDRDPAVTIHQNIFVLFDGELKKVALNINNTTLQNNLYKSVGLDMPSTPVAVSTSVSPSTSSDSKANKIKELHELYKSGALSEEEYNKEKTKILNNDVKPSTSVASSPMEAMLVQKFNQQNGTNFTSMKEIQEYAITKKQQ
ncbi:SHOCT domain-containing protein [Sulfurospirillum sp. SCADC]|uniref:SHOCT domain-containing protein n=1 Tax=Sulfurospirillum sp. SCADC TaxID=1537915 RepID=UPI0005062112|nr:SHOCT domain-containing protein [Sulfurospirillum sp. SCADC]KFL32968.1 hypothetical protein JU57_13775 [Sulfurospirillum sp. SCADC]